MEPAGEVEAGSVDLLRQRAALDRCVNSGYANGFGSSQYFILGY